MAISLNLESASVPQLTRLGHIDINGKIHHSVGIDAVGNTQGISEALRSDSFFRGPITSPETMLVATMTTGCLYLPYELVSARRTRSGRSPSWRLRARHE